MRACPLSKIFESTVAIPPFLVFRWPPYSLSFPYWSRLATGDDRYALRHAIYL
jgi:hypothetical protein